jgi:hypothetical protein
LSRPYAFINDEVRDYYVFRDRTLNVPVSARAKFDQLNTHLHPHIILPGEVVVMTDGPAHLCTPEEHELMALARDVHMSMIGHDYRTSQVLVQNYDLLQSFMGSGSIGIGSATGAWSSHLRELESLLRETEELMKRWRSGALTNDQFFAQRKIVFAKIETRLKNIGRLGSGLDTRGKIKNVLGISTKNYLHTGELRGYARNVRKISATAKVLSRGTYVGVALDFGVGALEIQEACSMGREDVCTKAKYVETGKAAGGILGSALVGGALGAASGSICAAFGIPSGGTLLVGCAVVFIAAGSIGGGLGGSALGEMGGTKIFSLSER